MIKHIASCPYCRGGEIALDYQEMAVVFNPDSARQQPCEHLVFIEGMYCCGEVLPDGKRRAAMAKLLWRHPEFVGTAADELRRRADRRNAEEKDRSRPPEELPCDVEQVQLSDSWQLAREDLVRWYDQVGWDHTSPGDLPSQEHRVSGWILFARHSADLAPALAG